MKLNALNELDRLALMTAVVAIGRSGGFTPNAAAELALELLEAAEDKLAERAGFNRDMERLEAAAALAVETYPEGHERGGAFIVAFEDYDRLSDLAEALKAFRGAEKTA